MISTSTLFILYLPKAFCNERYFQSTTSTVLTASVFITTAVVVLGPCMLGLFRIKQTLDREKAADLLEEKPSLVQHDSMRLADGGLESQTGPQMTELATFKSWFSLFEKRISNTH